MGRKEVFYCSKWCRTDGYEQVVRFRLDAACDAKNRRRLVTCPAHFSLDAAMCVSDINHLNRWLELRRDHPKEFMDDLFEGGLVWHEPWMDFNEQRSSEDIMSLIVKTLREALDYGAKLGVLIVLGPRSEAEEYWPDNTWQMSDLWSATITAFLEADTKACEAAIRADRRVPNNLLVLRGCLTAEVPLLTEPAQTVRASHCTGRGEEGRLIEEVRLTDLRADLPTYMRLYLSTYYVLTCLGDNRVHTRAWLRGPRGGLHSCHGIACGPQERWTAGRALAQAGRAFFLGRRLSFFEYKYTAGVL